MKTLNQRWNSLMTGSLTDRQVRDLATRVEWAGQVCERVLKTAVVVAGIFLLIEISAAFLPGGAVERVLNGGR